MSQLSTQMRERNVVKDAAMKAAGLAAFGAGKILYDTVSAATEQVSQEAKSAARETVRKAFSAPSKPAKSSNEFTSVTAPVATSLVRKAKPTRFKGTTDGLEITTSYKLGSLRSYTLGVAGESNIFNYSGTSGVSFAKCYALLNPCNVGYLSSRIADVFDQYRYTKATIEYVPIAPTSTSGNVVMCYVRDASEVLDFESYVEAKSTGLSELTDVVQSSSNSTAVPVWQPCKYDVPLSDRKTWLYQSTPLSNVPVDVALNMMTPGCILFGLSGVQANVACGDVYIHITMQLRVVDTMSKYLTQNAPSLSLQDLIDERSKRSLGKTRDTHEVDDFEDLEPPALSRYKNGK